VVARIERERAEGEAAEGGLQYPRAAVLGYTANPGPIGP